MQEVPLLSPCPAPPAPPPAPAPMLSKNVGGKFKYLNRKISEFLAGNANAKCRWKMQMRKNSEFSVGNLNSRCIMQMQSNAKRSNQLEGNHHALPGRPSVKPLISTDLLWFDNYFYIILILE